MKELSKSQLMARYNSARSQSDKWMSQLQQSYQLVMPNKAEFNIQRRIEGGPRTQRVFDSTAITGLKRFAANIQQVLETVRCYYEIREINPTLWLRSHVSQ